MPKWKFVMKEDFKSIPLEDAIIVLQSITPSPGVIAKVSVSVSYYEEEK